MAVLHMIRSLRFLARGRLDRARLDAAQALALQGTPVATTGAGGNEVVPVEKQPAFVKTGLSCAPDSTVTMYMGFRLTDAFGHVNNSKYLEMFEFGRWYGMSFVGLDTRAWHAAIYPVVRGVSIQYLKEIKPFQKVVVRTQFPMNTEDGRTAIIAQQIESLDGKTVFATGVVRASFLNMPVKEPSDALGKSLKRTRKGIIPIDELMDRVFCFKEEREAATKYQKGMENKNSKAAASSSTAVVGPGMDMFNPSLIMPLNAADEAWRGDVIRQLKLKNGVTKSTDKTK